LLGSFRPAHSARLVKSLDVPVDVRVFDYEPADAEARLGSADALVFAGGPLMDLPELLVKHWNVALKARSLGLPFIMERIGVGPFARRPSRYVAKRIARLATSLSVRTSGAARQPELRGLDVSVKNDPAFTYLESRGSDLPALSMLRAGDRREVDSLLRGAENKFKVGINLRPMRHLWSPRGHTSSRRAETQCLERIAEALVLVGQKIPTRYVFFPMNPIQLGGSDLQSAWQLHKLLGRDTDFRVWQGNPEIDGLLFLLRRLDAAVTMRFHACIFALSQGLPTLGIDYYPHAGGKVEELFADCVLPGDVSRVDILETRWLADKLEAIASASGYRG
jgi:polysaccharide pyruvyl transferase WcaK-like protein